MRLLDTHTHKLTEFFGDTVPDYAILSHTWIANEEISLQDLEAIHKNATPREPHPYVQRSGYKKIEQCCHQARQEGFSWVWIDTCCIDKTSSAELSEAINSMFQWYRGSRICYTLLSDVSEDDHPSNADSEFRVCRWLTRGWTLQEMLAPPKMVFFSKEWTVLGTRHDWSDFLSRVTGVPRKYLHDNHQHPLSQASVAQRMSWVAARTTTRVEDIAYCLLGIFDVNMPLLYGEGTKAFTRLQEEIIRQTDDQTIFTWGYTYSTNHNVRSDDSHVPDRGSTYHPEHAYLARAPSEFARCSNVVIDASWSRECSRDFEITRRGLRVTLPLVPAQHRTASGQTFMAVDAVLDCREDGDLFNLIVVPLHQLRYRDGEFVTSLFGPPKIRSRSSLSWPSFETFYISFAAEENKPLISWNTLVAHGAIIIPERPGETIELLASTDDITMEAESGRSHRVLTRKTTNNPREVTGRAYLQCQRNDPGGSNDTVSFLVLLVYDLLTPSFRLNSNQDMPNTPTLTVTNRPPDFSSVPLSNSRKPKKLQRNRIHFEEHLKALYDEAQTKDKIRRYGAGWGPASNSWPLLAWFFHLPRVTVHCLIARQPNLDVDRLRDSAFLEQLNWEPFVEINGIKHVALVTTAGVQGFSVAYFALTVGELTQADYHLSYLANSTPPQFVMLMYRALKLHPMPQFKFAWERFALLTAVTFATASAAAVTILHQNTLAGAVWITLAIHAGIMCMGQMRRGTEVPSWVVHYVLATGTLSAITSSVFVPFGIIALVLSVLGLPLVPGLSRSRLSNLRLGVLALWGPIILIVIGVVVGKAYGSI